MKNENENNGKSVEKTKEEIIDALIKRMEESGATIEGLRRVIDAIEKRKTQLNNADHDDEQIKIVRRTISSEVKHGIVIAMNDEDTDYVVFAKGETRDVVSIMTASLFCLLSKIGVSPNEYVEYLQLVVSSAEKKGGMK